MATAEVTWERIGKFILKRDRSWFKSRRRSLIVVE